MTKKEKSEIENKDLNENPFSQEAKPEETSAAEEGEEKNKETEALQIKCKTLEEELENKKNQHIRLAADFDNYRKRQEQEREALLKYGAEDTIRKLFPILDTMEKAKQSFQEIDDCQQLKQSFDVIQKQLSDFLDKIGLEKIETIGKQFDPNLHEAVMQTPTEEHEDHSIVAELQGGYKLHNRTVRPALVNVAVKE